MFGAKRIKHRKGSKPHRPAKWVPYSREREILDRVHFVTEVITFVLIILTILALINERDDRRAQTNAKIRHLACFVVSFIPPNRTNPLIEGLRKQYNCPPYTPQPKAHHSKARAIGPGNKVFPSSSSSGSSETIMVPPPIAGRQPLPERSSTPVQPSPSLGPTVPASPTQSPRPRHTPTRTVTVTPTPPRSTVPTRTKHPHPSPTVILPSLLCDQLQICITLPPLP